MQGKEVRSLIGRNPAAVEVHKAVGEEREEEDGREVQGDPTDIGGGLKMVCNCDKPPIQVGAGEGVHWISGEDQGGVGPSR